MRTTVLHWLSIAALVAGCDGGDHPRPVQNPNAAPVTNTPAAAEQVREYETRSLIRDISSDLQKAVIRHEEIPGYMPKMVMELNVRDTNELGGLKVGDVIAFKLAVSEGSHWIHSLKRIGQETNAIAGERSPAPVAAPDQTLSSADLMPDFQFTDETGRKVSFSDFRGKALAFTFIFTRCPLPEFCPRMGRQFSLARDLLRKGGTTQACQLLSISFDPDNDTPEVLARYAKGYRGEDSSGWLFATASHETLSKLAPLVDLVLQRESGSISHNLRTVVLDTRGRVYRVFPGNDWKAQQLTDAILEASRR